MKHIMLFLFLGLSLPIIAQTGQDSAKLNTRYEYLTIIVTSGPHNVAFIAKDSLKCEKVQLKKDERYNLTDVVALLSKYNEDGWLVLNSNIAITGGDYPYELSYLYYLLYRKKK